MKKFKKHLLSFFTLFVLSLSINVLSLFVVSFEVSAATDISWGIENDTLTIKGTGAIEDYELTDDETTSAPWGEQEDSIKYVIIDSGITTIGDYAFSGLDNLVSVYIPSSVEEIGDYAFANCANLTRANYTPYSKLSKLGTYAFSGCTSLTNITLPDDIANIESAVFYGCTNLTGVCITGDNVSINTTSFFYNCTSLNYVVLPASTTILDRNMFYKCTSLKTISIPASVTAIAEEAFSGCKALSKIYFTGNLPEIGNSFKSVQATAYYFYGAIGFDSLGSRITEWGSGSTIHLQNPLGDGTDLCGDNIYWSFNTDGVLTLTGTGTTYDYDYLTSSTTATFAPWYNFSNEIKQVIIDEKITSLGTGLFYSCRGIHSIDLPEQLTSIGNGCFTSCYTLKNITIPNSVMEIGENAFYLCLGLQQVTLPTGITELKDGTFTNCQSLDNVIIPGNVKTITGSVFSDNLSLKTIKIENGLQEISGWDAFSFCTSLESIVLPESLTTFGYCMFYGCTNLTSVNIPSQVKSIPYFCFYDTGITAIVLPDELTTIESSAFSYCMNLKEIRIPASVTSIEEGVFGGCTNLNKIYFEGDLPILTVNDSYPIFEDVTATVYYPVQNTTWSETSLDGYGGTLTLRPYGILTGSCGENATYTLDLETGELLIEGSGAMTDYLPTEDTPWYAYVGYITKITVSEGITKIGDMAFFECYKVTEVSLPSTLTEIGSNAFQCCDSLLEVIIPASVTSIGAHAFEYCTQLERIYFQGSLPTIGDNAFESVSDNFVLYYPSDDTSWNDVTSDQLGGLPTGDPVQAHEHNFVLKSVIAEATCYKEGSKLLQCDTCKVTKTEAIEKTSHNYKWVVITQATCSTDGKQVYQCQNDGCTSTNGEMTLSKTNNHDWTDWTVISEATVFKAEIQSRSCKHCSFIDDPITVGTVLTPIATVNATSIKLKVRQKTSKIVISGLANGDYVESWTCSNTKRVKVTGKQDGTCVIKAQNKTGKAIITATLASKKTVTIKVNVQKNEVQATKITGISKKLTLKKGKSLTLKPVLQPITCIQKIKYSSSKSSVVKVTSKGKLTAKKTGKAVITIKAGKKSWKCTVTVK